MNQEQYRRDVEVVYWCARERWANLTKDDLQTVRAQMEQMQDQYGVARAEAETLSAGRS
jgi:hypothetical protein